MWPSSFPIPELPPSSPLLETIPSPTPELLSLPTPPHPSKSSLQALGPDLTNLLAQPGRLFIFSFNQGWAAPDELRLLLEAHQSPSVRALVLIRPHLHYTKTWATFLEDLWDEAMLQRWRAPYRTLTLEMRKRGIDRNLTPRPPSLDAIEAAWALEGEWEALDAIARTWTLRRVVKVKMSGSGSVKHAYVMSTGR